jgi:hypothetical protein
MQKKIYIILLLISLTTFCCKIDFTSPDSAYQSPTPAGCILPPEGFTEMDLVGTWIGSRFQDTDTLIIRSDGKYKQIIHLEYPTFDFESDWQTWWLEYSESGTPYLHLEGMRLCAADRELDCNQPGGGQDVWNSVCGDRSGLLINEGILAVIGPLEGFNNPPRGITLILYERYYMSAFDYTLQESE